MKAPLKLIPAAEARRILLETPPVGVERVALRAAGGRVLAEAFAAPEDLPAQRRAVMDGFAVRAADVQGASESAPATLRVIGTVPMGDVFAGRISAGEAVAIPTGGFVPDGADAVVMVEHTAPHADGVAIARPAAAGANLIQPAEDVRRGDPLLQPGRRLRAQDVAALATFGVTEAVVFRRPRVAVLSTGNELCPPSEAPRPGQVRDSNQYALAAAVAAAGCEATYAGILPDDAAALRAAVDRLLGDHDGLILSGGSSVGTKDLSGEALGGLPAPGVLFHGIDIRPGKPTLFARAGAKPVLGMPGFPTSALIVFDVFVRPLLRRLGGEPLGHIGDAWPARRPARLGRAVASVAGREDYVRVRLVERDGEMWADPLAGGSAALSNVVLADGLVCVPAERDALPAGAPVEVLLYG
jgi:molybdopterin molybdotransferase